MAKEVKVVNNKFGTVAECSENAKLSRKACQECGLANTCNEPFLRPYLPLNWTSEYLFIVEVSSQGEANYPRRGVFLSESEGKVLGRVLSRVGLNKDQVAFYPVLRCRPNLSGSKKAKMHSLRACRPFLLDALREAEAKHILLCGEACVRAFTNSGKSSSINTTRGRELSLDNYKAYATVSLKSLVADPHASARFTEDLQRFNRPLLKYPGILPSVSKKIQSSVAQKTQYLGFDTEFSPDLAPITLGIATEANALGVGIEKSAQALPYLQDSIIVGHNVTVDVESLIRLHSKTLDKALNRWLQGDRLRDTSLLARLADENRGKGGYKLESLATSLLNVKDWKGPTEALGTDSTKWPKHLRDERCRLDAWATLQIYRALEPDVEGPARLSHKIAMTLRRFYWTGVYISKKNYQTMKVQVEKERAAALGDLTQFAKKFGLKDFSPTKDDHLRDYVYGENGVGLRVGKLTKGGLPTVSVKTLKEFKDRPAISALIQFSKYDKLLSTYCESLAKKFQPVKDGIWIPVIINPLAAKTGRRSSAAPNFQNWPVAVRKIITSRWQNGVIADNDYSKLEPILGGWVTGEPKLTDYFVKHSNGYIKIGEDFFQTSVDKNSDQYKAMKSLVLAILYNKKKWSLAEDLWVNYGVKLNTNYDDHIEESGKLLDKFLKLFPRVKKYHETTEDLVLTEGVIYNALGQARRLPLPIEPQRSDKLAYKIYMKYKAHVINQAINYRIQSLASYVTGCAAIDLEAAFLRHWKWDYLPYQQALMEKRWPRIPLICIEVHDDLVQDIPPEHVKKAHDITHEIMQCPPSLKAVLPELFDSNVTLTVDTNTGPTWGLKS